MSREKKWHVATSLLSPTATLWSNLGYWSLGDELAPLSTWAPRVQSPSYERACETLATKVGEAACLQPGMKILDLACGYGASIDHWVRNFGVAQVDVLDIRQTCIAAIKARKPAGLGLALVGGAQNIADHIAPQGLLTHGSYDAIVCVDAAYHFGDPKPLFQGVARLLNKKGVFAWTNLTLDPRCPALSFLTWIRPLLYAAAIPRASILSLTETEICLRETGLNQILAVNMDKEVLGGFAQFVETIRTSWIDFEGVQLDKLKIAATAHMARMLLKSGKIHYHLLAASFLEPSN